MPVVPALVLRQHQTMASNHGSGRLRWPPHSTEINSSLIVALPGTPIHPINLCARSSPGPCPIPPRFSRGSASPSAPRYQKLYHSDTLTILNVIWAPKMTIMPHDHRMWAVIGVYSGREDNIFWRRVPGSGGGKLEAAGAKDRQQRDAEPLGHNIIHSVTNPIRRLTGAIHVYGGDFFRAERSEWDPETLLEERYNVEKNMRLFEEANATLRS